MIIVILNIRKACLLQVDNCKLFCVYNLNQFVNNLCVQLDIKTIIQILLVSYKRNPTCAHLLDVYIWSVTSVIVFGNVFSIVQLVPCLTYTIPYFTEQMNILDSLHKLTSNRTLVFGPGNYETEYVGCLVYCLIQICEEEHISRYESYRFDLALVSIFKYKVMYCS